MKHSNLYLEHLREKLATVENFEIEVFNQFDDQVMVHSDPELNDYYEKPRVNISARKRIGEKWVDFEIAVTFEENKCLIRIIDRTGDTKVERILSHEALYYKHFRKFELEE